MKENRITHFPSLCSQKNTSLDVQCFIKPTKFEGEYTMQY